MLRAVKHRSPRSMALSKFEPTLNPTHRQTVRISSLSNGYYFARRDHTERNTKGSTSRLIFLTMNDTPMFYFVRISSAPGPGNLANEFTLTFRVRRSTTMSFTYYKQVQSEEAFEEHLGNTPSFEEFRRRGMRSRSAAGDATPFLHAECSAQRSKLTFRSWAQIAPLDVWRMQRWKRGALKKS